MRKLTNTDLVVDTGNHLYVGPEAESAPFTGYCMVQLRLAIYLLISRAGNLGRNHRESIIIHECLYRRMVFHPEIFLDTDLMPKAIVDGEICRDKVLHEELLDDRIVLGVDVEADSRESGCQITPHSELLFVLNLSGLVYADDLNLSLCKLGSQIILHLGQSVADAVRIDCVRHYHSGLEV